MKRDRLVVGIGSPHGNDRVGWEIARRLAELVGQSVVVRCAQTPAQLLDWLDGIDRLDVCDAVAGDADGAIHCWPWPAPEIARGRFRGSHDLELAEVLDLAQTLGRLPAGVFVWGVEVRADMVRGELSQAVSAAVARAAEQICGARQHA